MQAYPKILSLIAKRLILKGYFCCALVSCLLIAPSLLTKAQAKAPAELLKIAEDCSAGVSSWSQQLHFENCNAWYDRLANYHEKESDLLTKKFRELEKKSLEKVGGEKWPGKFQQLTQELERLKIALDYQAQQLDFFQSNVNYGKNFIATNGDTFSARLGIVGESRRIFDRLRAQLGKISALHLAAEQKKIFFERSLKIAKAKGLSLERYLKSLSADSIRLQLQAIYEELIQEEVLADLVTEHCESIGSTLANKDIELVFELNTFITQNQGKIELRKAKARAKTAIGKVVLLSKTGDGAYKRSQLSISFVSHPDNANNINLVSTNHGLINSKNQANARIFMGNYQSSSPYPISRDNLIENYFSKGASGEFSLSAAAFFNPDGSKIQNSGDQDISSAPLNKLESLTSDHKDIFQAQVHGNPIAGAMPILDLRKHPLRKGATVFSCGYAAAYSTEIQCESQKFFGFNYDKVKQNTQSILTVSGDSAKRRIAGGASGGLQFTYCPSSFKETYCAISVVTAIADLQSRDLSKVSNMIVGTPIYLSTKSDQNFIRAKNPNPDSSVKQSTACAVFIKDPPTIQNGRKSTPVFRATNCSELDRLLTKIKTYR